jgi:hypothetical protein
MSPFDLLPSPTFDRLLVKGKVPFAAQRTPRDEALAASMN